MSANVEILNTLQALLGTSKYLTLIACLPDAFVMLPKEQQTPAWRKAQRAVLSGETNVDTLLTIFADELEVGVH